MDGCRNTMLHHPDTFSKTKKEGAQIPNQGGKLVIGLSTLNLTRMKNIQY